MDKGTSETRWTEKIIISLEKYEGVDGIHLAKIGIKRVGVVKKTMSFQVSEMAVNYLKYEQLFASKNSLVSLEFR
jgi:hypothetical protein